jgi:hypothetical protein
VAAKLAFSHQPSNALTGAPISPAITVAVEDGNGNVITTATNQVTLALVSGAGLGGTLTAVPSSGVATFNDVTESTAGTYMLSATSAGLASATSAGFSVTAPINNGTTIQQTMPSAITSFPGGTFQITYNWSAVPVAPQASVFVDFVDSNGTVQYQDTSQPPVATSQWAGSVRYTHTLTVPAAAALGKYSIVAGLQTANGNISLVAGPGVTSFPDATYQVGTLVLTSACSITSFGATGDGVTDNLTAIQSAFNYAAANQCVAVIPAGTFAYSGNITANGIAVTGAGASSILTPLSLSNQALILTGSGSSVSNFVMKSSAVSRLSTSQSSMIWANNASNYVVENVLIDGSSSVGIFSLGSSNGEILNNTVENTLADSISQSDGSNNITISGNRIVNSGDDGISNNSYFGEPGGIVHDITVQGNTVLNNAVGRGLEVSGGNNIIFTGNYVDNPDGFADMYIASELTTYNTVGVDTVTVTGNAFADGGPDQGSLLVNNTQGTAYAITNVTVSGNQFINPQLTSVQSTGNGAESGAVSNNMAYTSHPFSLSSNSNATLTQSNNQVLAPSTFTTPLVPPGGGCNFTGC